MTPEKKRIQKNGIFYTPPEVARLLADELLRGLGKRPLRVLDPSCGNAALLSAAVQAADETFSSRVAQACEFEGHDLFSPPEWPQEERLQFKKGDFFKFSEDERFDAIIMNPPYVQYGRLKDDDRKALHETFAQEHALCQTVDLWVYFLLKAIRHLKPGGRIAAVIPWSFVEAKYAIGLRQFLAESFGKIRVIVLRDRHFDTTAKRVLLLCLETPGHTANSVKIAFSGTAGEQHEFLDVPVSEWRSAQQLMTRGFDVHAVLAPFRNAGFCCLEDFANVYIGLVTGANRFFIVSEDEAGELGFSRASRMPVLTHVNDLTGLEQEAILSNVLLQFDRLTERHKAYLRKGKRAGIHRASHCRRRVKAGQEWYDVDAGRVPSAFFTYRVSKIPFLTLNPNGFQCTNTLHKVLFKKDVTPNDQRWIQLAVLSNVGQLSLEAGARHYGNGILKIEPYLLKQALVYRHDKPVPSSIYQNVSDLIMKGEKGNAAIVATQALRDACDIPSEAWENLAITLRDVRLRRNGTDAHSDG